MSDEGKIVKHIQKKLPQHVAEHSLRVATIARNIAAAEDADEDVCYIAGLLHDIGFQKGAKNHAQTSAELTRDFLAKNDIAPTLQEEIIIAIRTHMLEPEPSTLEGWVVSDADIIERIGPVGIHRSYINGLYWNKLEPEETLNYLDFVLDSTARIYTPTAKRFARKDIVYFKEYMRRLDEDLGIEDDEE